MTINQIILLLDIYRGYNGAIHPATIREDIALLLKKGFITRSYKDRSSDHYIVTDLGDKTCKHIKELASI